MVPTTFCSIDINSTKRQVPYDWKINKSKSENDPPHEAMGVGIQIRLVKDVAPLGANLNWNDAYNVCDRHFEAMYNVLNK